MLNIWTSQLNQFFSILSLNFRISNCMFIPFIRISTSQREWKLLIGLWYLLSLVWCKYTFEGYGQTSFWSKLCVEKGPAPPWGVFYSNLDSFDSIPRQVQLSKLWDAEKWSRWHTVEYIVAEIQLDKVDELVKCQTFNEYDATPKNVVL
jgi:hypothetical protein